MLFSLMGLHVWRCHILAHYCLLLTLIYERKKQQQLDAPNQESGLYLRVTQMLTFF